MFLKNFENSDCCNWIKVILMDIEMPFMDGF
jgi:CheY-like chemotaxis protein